MIGLDTNVLIRFLVEDDPRQAAAAGCETVLTFDKALLRERRFEAP